jgi:hypothetical protein
MLPLTTLTKRAKRSPLCEIQLEYGEVAFNRRANPGTTSRPSCRDDNLLILQRFGGTSCWLRIYQLNIHILSTLADYSSRLHKGYSQYYWLPLVYKLYFLEPTLCPHSSLCVQRTALLKQPTATSFPERSLVRARPAASVFLASHQTSRRL